MSLYLGLDFLLTYLFARNRSSYNFTDLDIQSSLLSELPRIASSESSHCVFASDLYVSDLD